jgi:hypothetical protein
MLIVLLFTLQYLFVLPLPGEAEVLEVPKTSFEFDEAEPALEATVGLESFPSCTDNGFCKEKGNVR